MRRFLDHIDSLVLFIISALCIALVIFDFFGLVSQFEVLKGFDFTKAGLLLIGIVGLQVAMLAFRAQTFHGQVPLALDRVVQSLDGIYLRTFNDAAEQDSYIAKRILEAQHEVCDLSWKARLSRSFGVGRRVNASEKIENSITKASRKIVYRELFVFSDTRRVERLLRRIEDNSVGYSCKYFQSLDKIPRLQFVMIDKSEVIFASSSYPKLCAISHPFISAIFYSYFNEAWDSATTIKDGPEIHHDLVQKIRQEYQG